MAQLQIVFRFASVQSGFKIGKGCCASLCKQYQSKEHNLYKNNSGEHCWSDVNANRWRNCKLYHKHVYLHDCNLWFKNGFFIGIYFALLQVYCTAISIPAVAICGLCHVEYNLLRYITMVGQMHQRFAIVQDSTYTVNISSVPWAEFHFISTGRKVRYITSFCSRQGIYWIELKVIQHCRWHKATNVQ